VCFVFEAGAPSAARVFKLDEKSHVAVCAAMLGKIEAPLLKKSSRSTELNFE
jgi:hypothetical protein